MRSHFEFSTRTLLALCVAFAGAACDSDDDDTTEPANQCPAGQVLEGNRCVPAGSSSNNNNDNMNTGPVQGCTDMDAANFSEVAESDDGSCVYTVTVNVDLSAVDSPTSVTLIVTSDNALVPISLAMTDTMTNGIWTADVNLEAGEYSYRIAENNVSSAANRFTVVDAPITVNAGILGDIAASLPFVLSDAFGPGGFFPDADDQDLLTDCADRPVDARGRCYHFVYEESGDTECFGDPNCQQAGAQWLNGNTFDDAVALAIASGANQVSFYAWGELGGEVVEFGYNPTPDAASGAGSTTTITLTTMPTRYSIPIREAYGSVLYPFSWRAGLATGQSISFWVTDVVWENFVDPDGSGCTDNDATNFDPDATMDNGSCTYAVTLNVDVSGSPTEVAAVVDGSRITLSGSGTFSGSIALEAGSYPYLFDVDGTLSAANRFDVVDAPVTVNAGAFDSIVARLPMVVSDIFAAAGFFPGANGQAINLNDCPARPEDARGACYKITAPGGNAGVKWLQGAGFGDESPVAVEAGATRVSFYAWGAMGGESVNFETNTLASGDGAGNIVRVGVPLSTTPTRYAINISGSYDASILFPFTWLTSGPATFWVTDLVWEVEPDLQTVASYPIIVDDVFAGRGEFGEGGPALHEETVGACPVRAMPPGRSAVGDCHTFNWDTVAAPGSFTGGLWLDGDFEAGFKPVDVPSGALAIEFYAWAKDAGQAAEFGVGDTNIFGAVTDTFQIRQVETLTTTPTLYRIDLSGESSYERISAGFQFAMTGTVGDEIAEVYVDDIRWVDALPSGCTNPTADNFDPAALSDDGSCSFAGAATTVLMDFEGSPVVSSRTFNTLNQFSTNSAQFNPNAVGELTRPENAETFFGAVLFYCLNEGIAPLPFSATATTLAVDVYSPASGVPILLKVEDRTNASVFVQTEVVTTTSGEFETLFFDMSDPTAGTFDPTNTYDKLIVFPDFGRADGSEETYFVDNITFVGASFANECDDPAPFTGLVYGDGFADSVNQVDTAGASNVIAETSTAADVVGGSGSAISVTVPASNFTGASFVYDVDVDLSPYNALRFQAKASQAASLDLVRVADDGSGSSVSVSLGAVGLTTSYQTFLVPLPDPSVLATEDVLFSFREGSDEGGYQFFLDEIQFVTLSGGEISNPRPAFAGGTAEIEVGQTTTVTGTVITYDINSADFTFAVAPGYLDYASDTTAVATVDGSGVVSGVTIGEADITAQFSSVAASETLDVTVVAATGPSCSATSGNLVVNGDFELGTLACGEAVVDGGTITVSTDNPSSGTNAANLAVPAPISFATLRYAGLGAGALAANDNVCITFDLRGTAVDGGLLKVQLITLDSGGGQTNFVELTGALFPTSADVWETVEYETPIGSGDASGGVTLDIRAETGGAGTSTTNAFVDNVSVTEGLCPDT